MDDLPSVLPLELQWPGRSHFTSYTAAFIFFVNSIRLQHDMYAGKVHDTYKQAYEQDFMKHLRKVSIDQDQYAEKISKFYADTGKDILFSVLPYTSASTMIRRVNGSARTINNVTFHPEHLPSPDYGVPPKFPLVELKMLIPALEPYAFTLGPTDDPEFDLVIYDSNGVKLAGQKIWLPKTREKWLSVSSNNLTAAVKKWYFNKEKDWHIQIEGIPAYPMQSYINLVMERSMNVTVRDETECSFVRNPLKTDVKCCKTKIKFDSEEMNKFGFDLSLLINNFYAPHGLSYIFCERTEKTKLYDCNPTKYERKPLATANWNNPFLLDIERSSNLTVSECNCRVQC